MVDLPANLPRTENMDIRKSNLFCISAFVLWKQPLQLKFLCEKSLSGKIDMMRLDNHGKALKPD